MVEERRLIGDRDTNSFVYTPNYVKRIVLTVNNIKYEVSTDFDQNNMFNGEAYLSLVRNTPNPTKELAVVRSEMSTGQFIVCFDLTKFVFYNSIFGCIAGNF